MRARSFVCRSLRGGASTCEGRSRVILMHSIGFRVVGGRTREDDETMTLTIQAAETNGVSRLSIYPSMCVNVLNCLSRRR